MNLKVLFQRSSEMALLRLDSRGYSGKMYGHTNYIVSNSSIGRVDDEMNSDSAYQFNRPE